MSQEEIPKEQLLHAGIIHGAEDSPGDFEDRYLESLLARVAVRNEKRALLDRVLHVPVVETHPPIEYPEHPEGTDWKGILKVIGVGEVDAQLLERVKAEWVRYLEHAYTTHKERAPNTTPALDYLLAHMQGGSSPIEVCARNDSFGGGPTHERTPFALFAREGVVPSERELYLYGILLDAGVRCDFRGGDLDFVRDVPLFARVVQTLGSLRDTKSLHFVIRPIYEAAEQFGETYIDTALRASRRYGELSREDGYAECMENGFQTQEPLDYVTQEPYLMEKLASISLVDARKAIAVLGTIRAIEGRPRYKDELKVNSFVYFTELLAMHDAALGACEFITSDFLRTNNLLDATPSEIILYHLKTPERLPLTEDDKSYHVTKKTIADRYAREQMPFLPALCTRFGIVDQTLPDMFLQDDVPDVVQRRLWPLRYIAEHPDMQMYIESAFQVHSLEQLVNIVQTILRERVDPLFEDRLNANDSVYRAVRGSAYAGMEGVELLQFGDKYDAKYIEWLGEAYKKTGVDPIQEVRDGHNGGEGAMYAWHEWYKDPPMFARACEHGVFAGKDHRPSHDTFVALVSDETLMTFIERHPTYQFFQKCLQHPENTRILKQWARNGLFEKVEGLGLFVDKQPSEVWVMMTRYSEYAPLMKIDTTEVSQAKEVVQALHDDCGVSDLDLGQHFPADFIVDASHDRRLLDIVQLSQPLSKVEFDAKYHGRYVLQDKLVWTTHIDPTLRDDFIEYLRQGNIAEGISGDFSQKNFAFLPESYKSGQEVSPELLERAWWRETAPWRERRRLIDFLESTHMRLHSIDDLQLLEALAKQYDMGDVAKLYTVLSESVGSAGSSPAELVTFVPYVKHFGLARMPVVYRHARALLSPNQNEPLVMDGVTLEQGEAGMRRMKELVRSSATKLVEQDAELRHAETSPITEDTFRYLLRFDTSAWARPGTDFAGAWERLDTAIARGTAGNLPHGYECERVVLQSVPRELDLGAYSEKYRSVTSMLSQGLHSTTFSNTRATLVEALRKDIEQKSTRIAQESAVGTDSASPRAEQVVTALAAQRLVAEKLLRCFEDAKTSEDILRDIAAARYSIPAFDTLLPPLMFRDVFDFHPKWRDHIEPFLQKEEPTVEAMRTLEEFMRIQVKEHALGLTAESGNKDVIYPHLSEKQRRFVQKYVPIKRFAGMEELVSATQSAPLEKKFLFVPSRGLMGEMSGYLADACWTRQQNIVENNQNMVPVLCVEEGDTPVLRGSFLLFENTVHAGNDKVLVVRGINPQDGLLAQATVGSFCDEVLRYAEGVAMARGIRYVVADTGAGIASNRPGVYTHLAQQHPHTERDPLSEDYLVGNQVHLDKVMNFNGYNITDTCRVLKELPVHDVPSSEPFV